jgi:hypothetical protein
MTLNHYLSCVACFRTVHKLYMRLKKWFLIFRGNCKARTPLGNEKLKSVLRYL